MPRSNTVNEGLKLPVISLGTSVTYPNIPINFDIMREGSIRAFEYADRTDKTVFLAFSKDPDIYNPETDELFATGIIAKIDQSVTVLEGAVRVSMSGFCRAVSHSFVEEDGVLFTFCEPEDLSANPGATRSEALRRHILGKMREDDALLITADHGCDPSYTKTTDHTREYTPMILYGKKIEPKDLGTRKTVADIAATALDFLGAGERLAGESMI